MLNWLYKLRGKQPAPHSIILIGIGYTSHKLWKALSETDRFVLTACIDEEPWSHRTIFQGARVHYPSELLALISKHNVELIVDFLGEQPQLTEELLSELQAQGARYVQFNPVRDSLEFQLDRLLTTFNIQGKN